MVFCPFLFDFTAVFSFFFCPNKRKTKQKENSPSAFFCLLRYFFPLKKKNSLRSNSFFFLTLQKAPTLHGKKKRPDLDVFWGGGDNIASLVGVDVFASLVGVDVFASLVGVGGFASLVRVDVFVYVIRIFRTTFSTARLPLFGRLNEITDKKRKTRFK